MSNKTRKLLWLDLDETLVHVTKIKLDIQHDFNFDKYYVYKRPHLDRFLLDISIHYNVGIWSSASDDYVTEIVKHIKPNSVDFPIIWGRSKCSLKKDTTYDTHYFEKRLDKLKKQGYKLEE